MEKKEYISLAVNNQYPFITQVGVVADFLTTSGNKLTVCLDNLTDDEILAFRTAPKVGLIVKLPVILFLFDFGKAGQYDSPFNVKLNIRKNLLEFYSIENKSQRLAIDMHLIENTTNTIKWLKLFTLPSELTLNFLSAVQDQLTMDYDDDFFNLVLNDMYNLPVNEMISKTKMYKAGT